MNILWVEDNPENKKSFWFASRNVKNITDFSEAEEAIEKELNSYDVVVLDIDLRNSDPEKVREKSNQFGLLPDIFLQKSGMVLFLILLEKGFPREQIIFLTGNADKNNLSKLVDIISSSKDIEQIKNTTEKVLDFLSDEQKTELKQKSTKEDKVNYIKNLALKQGANTYDIFCDAYKAICIKPPRAISKSNDKDAQIELRSWLEDHERDSNYLFLRRGIIEGCEFLKKHLKQDDNNLQFTDFIKDTDTYNITSSEIVNYLDSLSQFFPISKPNDIDIKYRLFVWALSHKWEENIDPQKINIKYGEKHTFAWIMKMVRNWTSHANLLDPVNSKTIAFLFLVNMRVMFKLSKEIENYEYILLNCISNSPDVDIDDDDLKKCISSIENRINEISNNGTKNFGAKVNDIHNDNTGSIAKYDYKQFIFQYFWVNQKHSSEKLTSNSDDFLPTLARHIYKDSFS